jgi:xanthine dehydrogenase YagR molybdenum-binding subunit
VASSTYPHFVIPGSRATIRYGEDQPYVVRIGGADIGTGTWTALTQIAADALGCPVEAIRPEIRDTALPMASVQGGSTGISCWGSATSPQPTFRDQHGGDPADGAEIEAEMRQNPDAERFAIH